MLGHSSLECRHNIEHYLKNKHKEKVNLTTISRRSEKLLMNITEYNPLIGIDGHAKQKR